MLHLLISMLYVYLITRVIVSKKTNYFVFIKTIFNIPTYENKVVIITAEYCESSTPFSPLAT